MTLNEVKTLIEAIASRQPNINTIIRSGNIYDLNTLGNVEYGIFCLTQQQHTENEGFRTYNFYMFVADRLMSDESNKIAVQSASIEVLSNIVNTLISEYFDVEVGQNISYQTFTQKFASETAGAYCSVSITVPVINCNESYEN